MPASRHVRALWAAFILAAGLSSEASAQERRTVTLEWDPNAERDLAGYVVMVGTAAGTAEHEVDVGKATRFAYDAVVGERRYAWVHAYNLSGVMSPASNSLEILVPAPEGTAAGDADGDRLADAWEQQFGVTDAAGDPDGDGVSNLDEFNRKTDPTLPNRWYFPEGAGGSFTTRLALVNPGLTAARGTILVHLPSGDRTRDFVVPAASRRTVELEPIAGGSGGPYATVVIVTEGGVAVEQTMRWNVGDTSAQGPGDTARGITRLSRDWYFAEGDTRGFETVLVLANDLDTPATVSVEFVRTDGVTVTRRYGIAPDARLTIPVNAIPDLVNSGFWTRLRSDVPIAAQRAMYLMLPSRPRVGGHLTAGVPAPARTWYFADGATGSYYDSFLVLANPAAGPVSVDITWIRPWAAPVTQTRVLSARAKTMIAVDGVPDLASTQFSAVIRSSGPIVAERAVYWRGSVSTWTEGHVSTGVTEPGTTWVLAEGERVGAGRYETQLAILNPAAAAAMVKVTFLPESGDPIVAWRVVAPQSRAVVDSRMSVVTGGRFGVLVESTVPVAVERSMYWLAEGYLDQGGSSGTGIRIR